MQSQDEPTIDYYQVLGVAYNDPPGKIKARYRLLALMIHPDIAGADRAAEFARYAQAYRVLGRLAERQQYNEDNRIFIKPRPLMPGTDLYQRIVVSTAKADSGAVIPLSFFRYEPCSLCWLSGCYRCNGQGMIAEKITVNVPVTQGTRNNAVVLIEGQGSAAEPGGSRGNLFVYVTIR